MYKRQVLGQVYRVKLSDGTYRGGPAYYIRNGLGKRVLSIITAFLYIIGVGLCIASVSYTHLIIFQYVGRRNNPYKWF